MYMSNITDLIDSMNDAAIEYIADDKKLKGYGLAALSGFIDGALYGCTCIGVGLTALTICSMISNKKK